MTKIRKPMRRRSMQKGVVSAVPKKAARELSEAGPSRKFKAKEKQPKPAANKKGYRQRVDAAML